MLKLDTEITMTFLDITNSVRPTYYHQTLKFYPQPDYNMNDSHLQNYSKLKQK